MKSIKKLLLVALPLLAMVVFFGCSKDDDEAPSGSHKVVFKAETSSDATMSVVVYTNESGDQTANSSVNSSTYTSAELTIPASIPYIAFAANGTGTSSSSTIKVQIWVDGKMVKENTGMGTALTATTGYAF